MLGNEYKCVIEKSHNGSYTVVVRLEDGAIKTFFQTGGSVACQLSFMDSITDELAESYFPKAGKKGTNSSVDNLAYQGVSISRLVAEARAKMLYFVDVSAKRVLEEITLGFKESRKKLNIEEPPCQPKKSAEKPLPPPSKKKK